MRPGKAIVETHEDVETSLSPAKETTELNYQELVRKVSEIPLINDANQTVSKVSVETLSYPDNGECEKKSAVSIVTFEGNTIEPLPGGTDEDSKLEAMEKAGLYYIC